MPGDGNDMHPKLGSSAQRGRSRWTMAALATGLTLATLLAGLVLGELWVRWDTGRSPLDASANQRLPVAYLPAVYARHVMAPDQPEALARDGGSYPINEHGYRGPSFTWEPAAGALRVIIYGGSAAFDPVQSDDRDWPRQVQRLLHDAGRADVEVINAGIPGHSTLDSVTRLLSEGHLLQPKCVVLYNGWNDLKDLHRSSSPLRTRRPYRPRDDPRAHFEHPLDRWFAQRSVWYLQLRERYLTEAYDLGPEGPRPAADQPLAEIHPQAWAQYTMALRSFVAVAVAANAQPVLMTQAMLIGARDHETQDTPRVHWEYLRLRREAVYDAVERMGAEIRSLGAQSPAGLIDAAAALSGQPSLFVDHVHLSAEGSQRLAELVARELAQQPCVAPIAR